MSKDQKSNVIIPVEMVENLQEKIGWISSTIVFWHYEKIWPMNLIKDICDQIYDSLKYDNIHKNVSLSHIIDK